VRLLSDSEVSGKHSNVTSALDEQCCGYGALFVDEPLIRLTGNPAPCHALRSYESMQSALDLACQDDGQEL